MTQGSPVPQLQALLRGVQLRATGARIAVLRCLQAQHHPISHGDLVAAMADSGLDRATLFRNLTDLTRTGLVTRRDIGDHVWRFELAQRSPHHGEAHPHFVCTACGDIRCLDNNAVSIDPGIFNAAPASNPTIEVQLRGRCGRC